MYASRQPAAAFGGLAVFVVLSLTAALGHRREPARAAGPSGGITGAQIIDRYAAPLGRRLAPAADGHAFSASLQQGYDLDGAPQPVWSVYGTEEAGTRRVYFDFHALTGELVQFSRSMPRPHPRGPARLRNRAQAVGAARRWLRAAETGESAAGWRLVRVHEPGPGATWHAVFVRGGRRAGLTLDAASGELVMLRFWRADGGAPRHALARGEGADQAGRERRKNDRRLDQHGEGREQLL